MTIYLMVKTHNKTGLKYLCKTNSKNPHKYSGSGTYWKLHLKKHGKDISTEIIRECQNQEELTEWGLYYSNLWSVVMSNDWANLIPENGRGGGGNKGKPGRKWTDKEKEKLGQTMSKINRGKKKPPRTEEHRRNMSKAKTGIKFGPCPDSRKEKIGESNRMSLNDFVKRSNEIHQSKYDYSKVEYKNAHTKIEIICPIHGAWNQLPHSHLNGKGCLQCSIINRRKS